MSWQHSTFLDHELLLKIPECSFGIAGQILELEWLKSYLAECMLSIQYYRGCPMSLTVHFIHCILSDVASVCNRDVPKVLL